MDEYHQIGGVGIRRPGKKLPAAFTVDVEEWFQVGAYETVIDRSDWLRLQSRIDFQIETLLELLSESGVKATFFCLGYIAKHHPKLIAKIAENGHEIASHGMDHTRIFHFSHGQLVNDLSQSKKMLEDISGQAVIGYRAPNFSLDRVKIPRAYSALEEAGYSYSSSVYPIVRDHYGDDSVKPYPHLVNGTSCEGKAGVVEIPMSKARIAGRYWPASGGGFFRLFPYWISENLLRSAAEQTNLTPVFYMHPWEIDPDQPKVPEASFKSRFRHRIGLNSAKGKLRRLLRAFDWGTMNDTIYQPFLLKAGVK